MRSRCAATSASSSQSISSVSSTSSTIAGMALPQNTHSATMSCRLSSTIMSATPNTYWRKCSMRCNHARIGWPPCTASCCPLCKCGGKTTSCSRPGCCKRLPRKATCVEDTNVRGVVGSHSRSVPRNSLLPPLTHTQWWCRGEGKPAAQHMHKGTRKGNSMHVAPQDTAMRRAHTAATRRMGCIQLHGAVLYFSPSRRNTTAPHSRL
ncbi:hypothetical protein MOQ_006799 [Trypanosoma cruzi marinkellei]|uniref:Uncharacterized protein n=1 Tax=Trypanosoma cruzi marinkellei TaxID=85056 RepID=K2MQP1_TRYCR|nr:hypothetical protein MOQ_006799 [Trypanosoma cruzi marinkellei]